jgi:signal transduction histidine kinase
VQEATATLSLSDLLDDLAKRYQRLRQPVTWAGAPPLLLTCRPLALKRALTNLIDNALRHAGDADLRLVREDNGWLRIEILDHGQGLPEAWLSKVFAWGWAWRSHGRASRPMAVSWCWKIAHRPACARWCDCPQRFRS